MLVKQGDFLCYRGQGSGGGDDLVAHLPGAVGPVLRCLGAPSASLRRANGLAAQAAIPRTTSPGWTRNV